ncbi:hypothetical protein [Bradyrhizobium sp. CCBAU 25338]|uniref:hypothetical protein n=1 Tax=Bradyrhizobium sp. CCBAU 25338 TaxID=1641877 RepID=UPI002303F1CD|nr:hypothetical protein [Bradyrhizobium sp. CCBAU 25338]
MASSFRFEAGSVLVTAQIGYRAIGTNRAREHSFEVSTRARVACVWIILASGDVASGDGGAVSTVIENLLSRKQKLVEQLEKAPSVEDRDRIEHQLEQINTALDFLDRPEAKEER